jgi:hypothetical protein
MHVVSNMKPVSATPLPHWMPATNVGLSGFFGRKDLNSWFSRMRAFGRSDESMSSVGEKSSLVIPEQRDKCKVSPLDLV